jgi:hypothetical protein
MLSAAETLAVALVTDPVVRQWRERVARELERRGRLTGREIQELRPGFPR